MTLQSADERWMEIRKIHLDHKLFYQLGGGLLLVLIGVFIGAKLFSGDNGYFTNLYTEVLSIAVTISVLNRLAQNREEQREMKAEQQRLIRAAGSTVNDVAKNAIDEIRKQDWLMGETGLLKGAYLADANLQGANFWVANLQSVNLATANLQGVNLSVANLRGANLRAADLQNANVLGADLQGANLTAAKLQSAFLGDVNLRGARLEQANLQDANLESADLRETNLERADLQGAGLWQTNLQGANLKDTNLQTAMLEDTKFDENTILPDGSTWTSQTDLRRFTDPNHPDFWRSDHPFSPAYWRKSGQG